MIMKKIYIDENGRKRVCTVNAEPSKCDPSFAPHTDANAIVNRYKRTGVWPGRPRGQYADLTSIGDLLGSMEILVKAKEEFSSLPAQVRKRFGNDMRGYLEFLADPSNDEEAIKLGLKVAKVVEDSDDKRHVGPAEKIKPKVAKSKESKNGTSAGDSESGEEVG